ncbi:hypothetical protein ASL22_17765 [Alcaligenes faecalis]|nr:hypothetical protein ASL22_17765 [Alcaligenes faecalis]
MNKNKLIFEEGLLPSGTYLINKDEFLSEFCSDSKKNMGHYRESARSDFYKPFLDIFEWAEEAGATSIVVGGSFISKKENPGDMDIVIFFAKSSQVPHGRERYDINGIMLDVQLLAEDQPSIAKAYLELLSTTRFGVKHGLVQIKFHTTVQTHYSPADSSENLEIVKVAYLGRRWSQQQTTKGILVPIHGIRTHAEEWLPRLCLSASTSGWAVAPYVYGYRGANVLRTETQKAEIVEGFRNWLTEIRRLYTGPISIVAHSFGTYVVGRYLCVADDISEKFDCVILCGSILNPNFNWDDLLDRAVVGQVLNTISANDEWVKYLPDGGIPFLAKDALYGNAGTSGFTCKHPRFYEISSSLLTHNNVFRDDVVMTQWLPFMEASKGSLERENYKLMLERIKAESL